MKHSSKLVTALLLSPLAACNAFTENGQKPNIVFILADDMGWGDLSCHGHPRFRTPNIDSLAMNGIDFQQFYVTSPVSSPSRAGFLTGSFPMRFSIHAQLQLPLNINNGSADWLDPDAPSYARMLQSVGYKTAHFGKWHLVEEASGTNATCIDAPPPSAYGFDFAAPMRGPWPELGTTMPRTTIRSVYDSAVEFIKQTHDQPFLMNVWIHESHIPVGPTAAAYDANSHITDERERRYAGVITDIDNGVGKIMQTLRELNIVNNTIVIFSSDNGPTKISDVAGDPNYYNFGTTGGRRGTKGTLYEGGIRLPFIIQWPAGIIRKNIIDKSTLISAVDLLPTLCSIIHGTLPYNYTADGENMRMALTGKHQQRRKPLFWYHGNKYAMREGNWKIITDNTFSNVELYNIVADSAETTNLANENPEIIKRMTDKLVEWKATLPIAINPECISAYRYKSQKDVTHTEKVQTYSENTFSIINSIHCEENLSMCNFSWLKAVEDVIINE